MTAFSFGPLQALYDAAKAQPAPTPELLAAIAGLDAQYAEVQEHEGTVASARSNYAEPSNDDVEVDDNPLVSVAVGGVWVNTWVWVATESDSDTTGEPDDESDIAPCMRKA